MKRVIREQRLGYVYVANVCTDGTPGLSPKGTTTVWEDDYKVFADLRFTLLFLKHPPVHLSFPIHQFIIFEPQLNFFFTVLNRIGGMREVPANF